ncbi:HTH domain-containing protein [Sphingomonas histidinilytica]|jgi:predicted DNA-binding transcriptional regulator YafY|uniref:Predicted DNA-binding transcriptional regulator YafY, contains an HTH and WYL domains n=1 Tax=Rhizorhabdus histidinilytica TaxID=439228 RepID=A0A1T5A104_9SPHN|nr:YafY family protein [Rhizorhabdus histidinilytica]MBO9376065.1 HTH domain-containing protein [Rhizorhabdus histidinilytica]QEH78423.1 YafY family transcriptional regulator [Sphingomonas sp. C8-2]SKB28606.1 Predicted DNA-binding transcriptional regulator YafY, contains an HTH and WYL domains [Rhizorhabdus histidinilytica]
MRRADRLFQIIQILRRSNRAITAADIAGELEVSPRTVYRDIADLIGQQVPIRGEAGFGYILDDAFDMPPLMLTPDEIEAAVLGAQWVAGRGDPVLAGAARDLIAKISSVVPERLRSYAMLPATAARPARAPRDGIDIARTRSAIHEGRKIRIDYRDEHGQATSRVIWPVVIGFFDSARMLAAWCELRQNFRHFRTDRVVSAEFLDDRHGARPGELRQRWKRHMAEKHGASFSG